MGTEGGFEMEMTYKIEFCKKANGITVRKGSLDGKSESFANSLFNLCEGLTEHLEPLQLNIDSGKRISYSVDGYIPIRDKCYGCRYEDIDKFRKPCSKCSRVQIDYFMKPEPDYCDDDDFDDF